MVDPANYDWVPVTGAPGVTHKQLGLFTERQCGASLVRLRQARHTWRESEACILWYPGSEPSPAGHIVNTLRCISTRARMPSSRRAEETELLCLVLPDLTGIGSLRQPKEMVQAAE